MQLDGFIEISGVLRSGIYALVAKGRIIYIGKSKTMLSRIYTHRANWVRLRKKQKLPEWLSPVKGIHFDEVHVRPCPEHLLDAVEREMIDIYRPHLNTLLKSQEKIASSFSLTVRGIPLIVNAPPPAPSIAPITRRF